MQIILLVGVPASGKSTVAKSLEDRFTYVANDDHIGGDRYLRAVTHAARVASQPVLCETPFSMTIVRDLQDAGFEVDPVFIIENEPVLLRRWAERNTPYTAQKGHITRQGTFLARAKAMGAYVGTSSQVIEYLKHLPID